MKSIGFLFALVALQCLPMDLLAQAPESGLMQSNGKIYVVIGVIGIILAGVLLFLWRLERKVSELERLHNEQ